MTKMSMSRRAARWLLLLLSTGGCGGEGDAPPLTDEACLPPNRLVGDQCLEPGVQDIGCPAGTLGLDDGSCQPAGVPPELCAEGFVHDGDAACEPILPADPCPKGQMALPGETACRPVMDCAAGTWGDIPVDGATIYVDAAYPGGDSDGSLQKPWTTISDAIAAAPAGALVAVAAGSYVEDVVITKPIRLWGVCPEQVEVVGTDPGVGALFLRTGSSGSEVRGLAVTGDGVGVLVSGAVDVVLDQLWLHDALNPGVDIEGVLGPTAVTLRSSLVEQNHDIGVYVSGSEATLEGVVVRNTLPQPSDQKFGWGINTQASLAGAPATALVRSSLIEGNHDVGVVVTGSAATLEGVVVRGTLPRASDQMGGRGTFIQASLAGAPSTALVTSSLAEQNHEFGVFVSGSEATLEGVVVRGTLPRASDQQLGIGIGMEPNPDNGAPSTALVRSSLVEQNHDFGVILNASEATLEGVVVRGTLLRASDGSFGDGVAVASAILPGGVEVLASAVVRANRIEANARAGLVSFGAHVALSDTALSCNAFQLNGEAAGSLPFTFENLGGNGCGCPEPTGACVAQSSGLAPPESVTEQP